jgi:hypothetical protein
MRAADRVGQHVCIFSAHDAVEAGAVGKVLVDVTA